MAIYAYFFCISIDKYFQPYIARRLLPKPFPSHALFDCAYFIGFAQEDKYVEQTDKGPSGLYEAGAEKIIEFRSCTRG